MILTKSCPWKEHLFSVEEEFKREGEIKYVVFQDTRGDYMMQSAPLSPSSFDNRAPFPGITIQ